MNKFVFLLWVVVWNFSPVHAESSLSTTKYYDLSCYKKWSKTIVMDTNSAKNNHKIILYVGTYTKTKSKGIYLVGFDTVSGTFSEPELVAAMDNPSFQCIGVDGKLLWSVSEGEHGAITGFVINRKNGKLKRLRTYSSEGSAPCYITYDKIENSVLATNYGSGNVVRFFVRPDGTARGEILNHQHEGSGPVGSRQSSPHAHSIRIDRDGHYAYSCDLGADKIYVYDLSQPDLHVDTIIQDASGSGPRHIAFHPGRKAMSVIHELNNTVSFYLPDQKGRFTRLQSVVSTLPASFAGKSYCADIHYSPDGRFLYASNRGHNSITIYKVNTVTMTPEVVGWMSDTINWPRNFTIDSSGHFLLVANQKADEITIYEIDCATGLLKYTGHKIHVSAPVCLTWLQ